MRSFAPVGEEPSLRIGADPRLDEALLAVRKIRAVVEASLSRHAAEVPAGEAAWTLQICRLIEQALDWRTLVERNRDVFLAENLSWLHRRGHRAGNRYLRPRCDAAAVSRQQSQLA